MLDSILQFFKDLSDYAGLFSLLSLIAAIFVPCYLYYKGRNDERRKMQDELDAMNDISQFPMTEGERNHYTRKSFLEKGVKK